MTGPGWVFLFACVTFACAKGPPAIEGDHVYRDSKRACERAAAVYARRNRISLTAREVVCVEREPEE